MLETAFTRMVGCSVPIQLAGMGPVLCPELAAAVSEAGALGQITFGGTKPEVALARLRQIESLTAKPYGVNIVMPYVDQEIVAIAAPRARVMDFFWGAPDRQLVDDVHAAGALASWQVASVAEAIAAERAGCDFIIVQGREAGGHLWGTLSLLPLLSAVLDAVSLPVLAAGGIGTARSLAAVLQAGAAGARMGTRFIAAQESNAHPEYVHALIAATSDDAVETTLFDVDCVMCPATHRVLRSSIAAAEATRERVVGEVVIGGETFPVPRFHALPPARQTTGSIAAMALYAGQSVDAVHRVQPAGEIVTELANGAEALFAGHEAAAPARVKSTSLGAAG